MMIILQFLHLFLVEYFKKISKNLVDYNTFVVK